MFRTAPGLDKSASVLHWAEGRRVGKLQAMAVRDSEAERGL